MRIIALPLRLNASKQPTFYSYRVTAPPPIRKAAPPRTKFTRWMPEEGLAKWASHKATRTWANFGTAEKGSLKLRAFQLGERLMDRLDFEESNLKTIDLSLAPPLKIDGKTVQAGRDTQVPLVYPPVALSGPHALDHLRALVKERIPLHNRGVWTWIFFAVLSAPLKLIPIIPNFPFYFCAWRTWSHWKAMRAARYIQGLLDSNRVVPEPFKALDAVYSGEEGRVLTRGTLERAMGVLSMASEERKELLRAREQVLSRLTNQQNKQ
ncbi:mitochondrial K+-H+ exchange-related-domain-containing protein [Mycena maculata]|uniref:Mitochondrial K+-H+ exchange-related-domain-containing protein n=1 Tax=Mycena maculata TaxID=230809 RepID=A0AAD7NR49_9AGAR|nr:mitochondrial K+-H+ exchange-related-domain-containing protein [Mycena maculata]